MGDDIEVQLRELRKQVEEDSQEQPTRLGLQSKAAEQKAADRAAEQTKQFDQMIINTSYQKLPFGSGDDPDKLFFHQALN